MTETGKTTYKICREQAGYTQERAAELLPCSVRALARYESGEVRVPDDMAYRMVRLYNSQFLAAEHLRQVSVLAADLIPPVEDVTLQTAAIRIVNRVAEFVSKNRTAQLLQIAEDGVISDAEQPLFQEIVADLEELVKVFTEVRLTGEKSE